jgi:hypothetical protein
MNSEKQIARELLKVARRLLSYAPYADKEQQIGTYLQEILTKNKRGLTQKQILARVRAKKWTWTPEDVVEVLDLHVNDFVFVLVKGKYIHQKKVRMVDLYDWIETALSERSITEKALISKARRDGILRLKLQKALEALKTEARVGEEDGKLRLI